MRSQRQFRGEIASEVEPSDPLWLLGDLFDYGYVTNQVFAERLTPARHGAPAADRALSSNAVEKYAG